MITHFKDTIPFLKDLEIPLDEGSLYIPMGLDEKGSVYCAKLTNDNKYQHAAILGIVGSGKSNVLNYSLLCLQVLYGESLKVHYLADKDYELNQWLGKFANQGLFREVHASSDFAEKLNMVTTEVCRDNRRSVVILDDVMSSLSDDCPDAVDEFERLAEVCVSYNAHILLVEQVHLIPKVSEVIQKWTAIGITRAPYEVSKYYYGNTLATTCTDKYGNMVVQHRNSYPVLKIPLVQEEDIAKIEIVVDTHD